MQRKTDGQRIRERREALGYTQSRAAKRAGFSQPRWAEIEADRYSMTLETLRRVARALRCKAVDLI